MDEPRTLLAPDEPPPFEALAGAPDGPPVLLVCDHASARVPRALNDLGLTAAARARHIAWDIGAAELARALGARLDAGVVLAGYSRLVIDCNRQLQDPTSIAAVSDGEMIPGNAGLSGAEREQRARECFWPYHTAVAAQLGALTRRTAAPAVIAVHSFTPSMQGKQRPWHCGVLWDLDARIAAPLIHSLRAAAGLVIGDNEPYSGRHPAGYTTNEHAQRLGWPHVGLEIRQDLIAHPAGVREWAERLSRALAPILADPKLYRVRV